MAEVLALLLILGAGVGAVIWQQRAKDDEATAREEGRLRHLRSGAFPSTCSWCRNTSLARMLFVFERVDGVWHARDLGLQLQASPSGTIDVLVRTVFHHGPSNWKRACSEKCTREFLAAERAEARDEFHACQYCSVRFPAIVTRCTNCGAVRP